MGYEIDRHPREAFDGPERTGAAPSRKPWATPTVIVATLTDDTEANLGNGADGGGVVGSHLS
jgi:hypothetical protein